MKFNKNKNLEFHQTSCNRPFQRAEIGTLKTSNIYSKE